MSKVVSMKGVLDMNEFVTKNYKAGAVTDDTIQEAIALIKEHGLDFFNLYMKNYMQVLNEGGRSE